MNEYVLLVSDVHANVDALRAVVADARARYSPLGPIWFIGDLFGRGPQPVEAWQWLQQYRPEATIIGNHDQALVGQLAQIIVGDMQDSDMRDHEWTVIRDHRRQLARVGLLTLGPDEIPAGGPVLDHLQRWPVVYTLRPMIYLTHGGWEWDEPVGNLAVDRTLRRVVWGYVRNADAARRTLDMVDWLSRFVGRYPGIAGIASARPRLVVCGHTHRRYLYRSDRPFDEPDDGTPLLDHSYDVSPVAERRCLVNPGSVGFSYVYDDGDPSYAVLTLREEKPYRITYHTARYKSWDQVRQRMCDLQYPEEILRQLRPLGDVDRNSGHNRIETISNPGVPS